MLITDGAVLASTVRVGEVVSGSTVSNGFRVDWEGRLFSRATAGKGEAVTTRLLPESVHAK